MPLPLLLAIIVAFGFESRATPVSLSSSDVWSRLQETLIALGLVGASAFVLGQFLAFRLAHPRRPGSSRRAVNIAGRVVDVLVLGVFAWIIHEVRWPDVVRSGMGLRGAILVDEVLILLPYLLCQVAVWWGFYPVERALRVGIGDLRPDPGLRRYLIKKARLSLGMVLPVALAFPLGQDIVSRVWPRWSESIWGQMIQMAGMGVMILIVSPALVRLTWPSHPLPPGPLRDRLERLASRFGFRYTDILVWDTDGALVNAGVTGILPWFRYVMMTDALLEGLDDYEVAAVFGHEMGHIVHRHLPYFGFFFLASLGMLGLFGEGLDHVLASLPWAITNSETTSTMVVRGGGVLLVIGLYFLFVFGHLSRRFERQADVFGCLAVSCGRSSCPPHADFYSLPGVVAPTDNLCPVGIRIFINALGRVATLNGMKREARSWRHDSIARRIAFLEGLEGQPGAVRRFQSGVLRLRVGLAVFLTSAIVSLAWATGAVDLLR